MIYPYYKNYINFCEIAKMYLLADHVSKGMILLIHSENRGIGNFSVLFFDYSISRGKIICMYFILMNPLNWLTNGL